MCSSAWLAFAPLIYERMDGADTHPHTFILSTLAPPFSALYVAPSSTVGVDWHSRPLGGFVPVLKSPPYLVTLGLNPEEAVTKGWYYTNEMRGHPKPTQPYSEGTLPVEYYMYTIQ